MDGRVARLVGLYRKGEAMEKARNKLREEVEREERELRRALGLPVDDCCPRGMGF